MFLPLNRDIVYFMISLADVTTTYRSKLIIEAYKKWLRAGEFVLDVGCGNGIVSWNLQNYFKIHLVGCDVINYLKYPIPFTKMVSESSLPNTQKKNQTIMFNDVLHHVEKVNQKKLLLDALHKSGKVLIFEVQPTFVGRLFDYILNTIHNKNMNMPFTFRSTQEWVLLFKSLRATYEIQEVKRPIFYPFSHIAFFINKNNEN